MINTAKSNAAILKEVANVANRELHLEVLVAIVQGKNNYDDIQASVGCNYKKASDAVHAWKELGLVESRKTGTKRREFYPVLGDGIPGRVIEVIFS